MIEFRPVAVGCKDIYINNRIVGVLRTYYKWIERRRPKRSTLSRVYEVSLNDGSEFSTRNIREMADWVDRQIIVHVRPHAETN